MVKKLNMKGIKGTMDNGHGWEILVSFGWIFSCQLGKMSAILENLPNNAAKTSI